MSTRVDDPGITPVLDSLPRQAVVVVVDGTVSQSQAVDWAASTAAAQQRPLALVALRPAPPGSAATLERELQEVERFVGSLAGEISAAFPSLTVLAVIPADDSLRRWLTSLDPSATLVIGRHARHLPTWLADLGVDAWVARTAPCPVVVVPQHHHGQVRRGVLAAIDLTAGSTEVLEHAFRHASFTRLPLTVAHWTTAAGNELDDQRRSLAESTSGFRESYPDVHVQVDVYTGRPAHELVEVSSTMHLLVVGKHRAWAPDRGATDRVRSGIVEKVACPVEIVPVASS